MIHLYHCNSNSFVFVNVCVCFIPNHNHDDIEPKQAQEALEMRSNFTKPDFN